MTAKKELTLKRYLALQGEGDYIVWRLAKISEELKKPKAPIELMIDEASGYWGAQLKQAKSLIRRFKKIKEILGVE